MFIHRSLLATPPRPFNRWTIGRFGAPREALQVQKDTPQKTKKKS
jgi:hypothetical protein